MLWQFGLGLAITSLCVYPMLSKQSLVLPLPMPQCLLRVEDLGAYQRCT
jgi:hypothetical protein